MEKRQPDALAPFRSAFAGALKKLDAALPMTAKKYLTPERLARITLVGLSRNPTLLTCTPESVLASVMDAAALGLEPVGPLGQAYLVPFKNKGKDGAPDRMEAQLIVGYRGLVALARRSGEIASVAAHGVYSKDIFTIDLAEGVIKHAPFQPAPLDPTEMSKMDEKALDAYFGRGQLLGVYCVAKFVGGGHHVDYMTIGDVERIRRRSRAAGAGPWVTDYDEMAKKTVVRRAAKYWPLSVELASTFDKEDRVERGEQVAHGLDIFDGGSLDPVEIPLPKPVTDQVLAQLQARHQTPTVKAEDAEPEDAVRDGQQTFDPKEFEDIDPDKVKMPAGSGQ